MTRYLLLAFAAFLTMTSFSQELSGEQLLDKAIAYHDPNGVWPVFQGAFTVTMTTPDEEKRLSDIVLKLPQEYFHLTTLKDGVTISQKLDGEQCELLLNESAEISEEESKTHRLSCERARMMKDYYTYLYGLPMKLKDPGTLLTDEVQTKTFKGEQYLVLKVNYAQEVGKDTWYFYFDPATYALKLYQFYHDESANDGEYIILTGEEEISGIKMPKTRAWYYNKDDKYLGTDVLSTLSSLEE